MKKGIVLAIVAGAFLAGCGHQQYNIPVQAKWQGTPYHISFDTQAAKPSPAGITIPAVKYKANPEAVESRAALVVRIEPTEAAKSKQTMDQMVVGPFDIHGTDGSISADDMELADKGLARLLTAYGVKGKVKVSVMLAKSSISSQPSNSEISSNRLSDWLPVELEFKTPHKGR